MFDRLIDLFIQLKETLLPWTIIHAYEGGVVLRFGKYNRTVAPGFHWKWPLIEHDLTAKTCVTTMELRPQTLTTKDNHGVVVSAIVKYQIKDVKPFLLDIWDSTDVLKDVTMGAIKGAVNEHTWEQLVELPVEQAVLEAVRKEVNRYGFKIEKVTFVDMGKVRSLRLMQTGVDKIDSNIT